MLLMSWGGVGLSDPIQHAHKKSRPKPLCWTRVAMVTSLPSGTRSAGNQLKVSVCVNVCTCGIKKLFCHHHCLRRRWLRLNWLMECDDYFSGLCPSGDFWLFQVLVFPTVNMW